MTPAFRFRVIGERNLLRSMEMSFFAWNMEMSFFGMPIYILDVCPENRDESNGNYYQALVAIHPDFRGLALPVT